MSALQITATRPAAAQAVIRPRISSARPVARGPARLQVIVRAEPTVRDLISTSILQIARVRRYC